MGPAAAPAVPGLLQALSEEDAHVRRLAAWSLGYVGAAEPEAADALQGALRDDDDGVRRMAGAALALLGLGG
jgi:HEAT repeat protein